MYRHFTFEIYLARITHPTHKSTNIIIVQISVNQESRKLMGLDEESTTSIKPCTALPTSTEYPTNLI